MLLIAALPHSDDAERAALGAVILDNRQAARLFAMLDVGAFYSDRHRRIFTALHWLHEAGSALDLVTLRDALERSNDLDRAGGVAYLAALTDGTARSANVEHYSNIVRTKAARREIIRRADAIMAAAANGETDQDVRALVANLKAAPLGDSGVLVNLADVKPEAPEYAVANLIRPGVNLVYGPSSVGKTFVILRLVTELLTAGDGGNLFAHPDLGILRRWQRVVWVSAEESAAVLRSRWDLVLAGLSLAPSDLAGELSHRWAFDPPAATLDRAEAVIESVGNVDALVLDSFTALAPPSMSGPAADRDGGNFAVRALFGRLRDLAVRQSVAVLLVHHEGKDPDRGPRGASELRNGADTVIRLEPLADPLVRVTVEKQRDGRKLAPFVLRVGFEPGALVVRHEPGESPNAARSDVRPSRRASNEPEAVERAMAALVDLVEREGRIGRDAALASVADTLHVSIGTARNALTNLYRSGAVSSVKATGRGTNSKDLVPGEEGTS